MGSLLSAISSQFAKIVFLGTLFPVVIVAALNIMLIAPLLPQTAFLPDLVKKIAIGDEKWPAVAFSFVVFVITGLLYDLNIPIIRIYEGYPWRKSLLGQALCRWQKYRLQSARDLSSDASDLQARWQQINPPDEALVAGVRARGIDLDLFLSSEFPDTDSLLLPTRLGNVIRCFERYPFLAYGMDAIIFWPRLVAKIDPGFASDIDQAKTSFDFMLNISFLSALTCLMTMTIGLAVPAPLEWRFLFPWVWRALLFAVMAVIFYVLSINRAQSWGLQIRGAFDLYRLDLLKALGYQQKPLSYGEERVIWLKLAGQLRYPDTKIDPLPYEDSSTRVIPSPPDIEVKVRREYLDQDPNLSILVRLTVINQDPLREISSLRIIDSLPDGYAYVPDSLVVPDNRFYLRRLSPLDFNAGPVPPNDPFVVLYFIKPATAQGK